MDKTVFIIPSESSSESHHKNWKCNLRPKLCTILIGHMLKKMDPPPAKIILSYHGEGYECLEDRYRDYEKLVLLRQNDTMYQMMHVKSALEHVDGNKYPYVCFLDDDDIPKADIGNDIDKIIREFEERYLNSDRKGETVPIGYLNPSISRGKNPNVEDPVFGEKNLFYNLPLLFAYLDVEDAKKVENLKKSICEMDHELYYEQRIDDFTKAEKSGFRNDWCGGVWSFDHINCALDKYMDMLEEHTSRGHKVHPTYHTYGDVYVSAFGKDGRIGVDYFDSTLRPSSFIIALSDGDPSLKSFE